jgi:phosphopantothenate-cysteine ligase
MYCCRYKESQACRTEAEYAFQQRKKIIPVLMVSILAML